MLLVRARAGASSIEGIGLIAQEPIPAGTPIWEFHEGFDIALTPEAFSRLSEAAKEQALHYGWFDADYGRLLLSGDDDRFTNHASPPNSCWNGVGTVATRDIQPGDEITFDYGELGGSNHLGWDRWQAALARIAGTK